MHFKSIRWRIAVPYVTLILVSMLGLSVYLSDQLRKTRLAELEAKLVSDARMIADGIASLPFERQNPDTLDSLAKRWADILGERVTVIGTDGTVLGESQEDRERMDNHLNRPEVQQALETGEGSSTRFRLIGDEPLLKPLVNLPLMAAKAQDMLHRALEAFVWRDVDLARTISAEDDEVDLLYIRIDRELLGFILADPSPGTIDRANHLLWAAHNLERAADRVTNICERVVFTVTGEMVEMNLPMDG
jgi:hypothetical protein